MAYGHVIGYASVTPTTSPLRATQCIYTSWALDNILLHTEYPNAEIYSCNTDLVCILLKVLRSRDVTQAQPGEDIKVAVLMNMDLLQHLD
jgi:hypothetical protein